MIQVAVRRDFHGKTAAFQLDAVFDIGGAERSVVLFGPSGSGKTLTMQAIAGLARPESGRIRVGDAVFFDSGAGVDLPPRLRRAGYVPQEYALFPHRTILQNTAFPRSGWLGLHVSRAERERALAMLDRCGIAHLADQYPDQLSGGQRQRVALARALNAESRILLLDEPFAALDAPLRGKMRREVRDLLDALGIPSIIISHDPADVEAFAGKIVLYANGRGRLAERLPHGTAYPEECLV